MNDQRQGDKLIALIKRRGMTAHQMLMTHISTTPLKRLAECMPAGYRLDTSETDHKGRTIYRVLLIKAEVAA